MELGEVAAKEAKLVKTAEENIRAEHAAVIASLESKKDEELGALQAKLEEAENLHEVRWQLSR